MQATQDALFGAFDNNTRLREAQAWRPWTLDGAERMGGYITTYMPTGVTDPATSGSFNYAVLRGTGHMAGEFMPQTTLEFMRKYLRREAFLPYVSSSSVASQAADT